MGNRWDETWHRLRDWTNGQGPSERLACQILLEDGFQGLDPSHPLGGPDGGKDAVCHKGGNKWIMACYFARGEKDFSTIKAKFLGDLEGVQKNQGSGFAFVTNQELRLAERKQLETAANAEVELYHLERITNLLDRPAMAQVRSQFLGIEPDRSALVLYERRLDSLARLWEAWTEFCNRAPSVFGVLHAVTYQEEKELNRNPKVSPLLKLEPKEFQDWMALTEAVEKDRPYLEDTIWRAFFAARGILGRIIFLLERDSRKSEMKPWRDDSGVRQYMNILFSADEISNIINRPIGAFSLLRDSLNTKLLGKINQARELLKPI